MWLHPHKMGYQQSERLVPKMTYKIPTKLLTKFATVPTYGSEEAAGMDLSYDAYSGLGPDVPEFKSLTLVHVMKPGERVLFKTGISMALPPFHYGRIAPRSGLAYKSGIDVMAGVIDSDYRGEIGVILINHGDEDFQVNHGDRIAQMIITPYEIAMPYVVEDLDNTGRGSGGFGSTGK